MAAALYLRSMDQSIEQSMPAHQKFDGMPPLKHVKSDVPQAGVPGGGRPTVTELFAQFGAYIWRVVRRLGVPESDADDLVQEIFMVVHRRLPDFEGRSAVKTWLYGISLRVVSDYHRRAHVKREDLVATPPPQLVDVGEGDPLVAFEKSRARAMLDEALTTLDEDKRAAFVLYEIEDFNLRELAEALQVPLQTAYSRLDAARRQVTAFFETRLAERSVG